MKKSFFDTNSSKKHSYLTQKLWLTKEEFSQKYKTSFSQTDKGQILYSGVMCKQDWNQEINEYEYKLYNKYLVQYSRQKIIGIMDLLFVQIEYEEEFDQENDELPFFLFKRNKHSDILVPETIESFYEWKKLLCSRCILNNFGQQYENLRIIGKGTFAKVLLCKRNSDGKKYAVKTYNKTRISNSQNSELMIKGIQNEVKLMQQLHHRNIIHLHEVYEGEFHIYLVLDLLTGGELFAKLHKLDNYTEKNACLLLKKLLESLDYLHSYGIMHRDIKPENLILRNDKSETDIILADFGLSEEQGEENDLIFKRCGTPGYVAPEILNSDPYNTKADIFSAGIIFYIILTGYSPFFGDSYAEILEKNKKCKICFEFERINVKLSTETLDLLKSMLKKDPNQRPTAQQALNHPFFEKFLQNNNDNNHLKLPFLPSSQQSLKDQLAIIKSTKPNCEKYNQKNQLITNSPVILGNTSQISSPFNADSPEVLTFTPDRKKKGFTEYQKEFAKIEQIQNEYSKQKSINCTKNRKLKDKFKY